MSERKLIKVKSSDAVYYIRLEDYDGIQPDRSFEVSINRPTTIPFNYARNLFIYPGIKQLFDRGSITFVEGQEFLMERLDESGEKPEFEKPFDQEEIAKILKGNNLTAIKKLFEGEYPDIIRQIAVDNVNEMAVIVVDEIEKLTGLPLRISD